MNNDEMIKILNDISTLKAEIMDIKKRLEILENGESGSGVYLEGCPDYAVEYIKAETKKREGE